MTTGRVADGIIIRADGTIPYDTDCPEGHRENTKQWLLDNNIEHEEVPGTRHLKIKTWPHPAFAPKKTA